MTDQFLHILETRKKKKIAVYMYYVVSCKFCCMFELTTTQLKLIHSSFGKHHNIQEQRGGQSVSKLHHIEQPSTMSTKICFRTFEVNSFLSNRICYGTRQLFQFI